jgi:hypothetical protein
MKHNKNNKCNSLLEIPISTKEDKDKNPTLLITEEIKIEEDKDSTTNNNNKEDTTLQEIDPLKIRDTIKINNNLKDKDLKDKPPDLFLKTPLPNKPKQMLVEKTFLTSVWKT